MPATSTLLVFALAAGVLVVIPGPNHLYILARSVSQGRRAGIASALGVEVGTLVHITAADLVYLGVRVLLSALLSSPAAAPAPNAAPHSLGRVFREGVVVNVLNPKVALFFLSSRTSSTR